MTTQSTTDFSHKLLFPSKEAAKFIDVSDETLRRSRCTGYLLGAPAPKHIKFGRAVKYRLTDLTDWVNAVDENGVEGL
ncbi:DNA-binding protein [Aliiglaciecola sp. 3_MG-2023]|uniref:helix-turn-helix transcriptional regulator n=1 Tax=Aliiglaciecola sp. 3_MG-2023 TaxID=3062644 RepID=UPI0026E41F33|nr:DNA-binding protein [Aliiglaciecola sp. 3_MG-2023]MDO6691801.1 DNA-binding protein [Aliiglaciecola sp. 3_MG-2023]